MVKISQVSIPEWLAFLPQEKKGKVVSEPAEKDMGIGANIRSIIEFYSR